MASGPIISWQTDGKTLETVRDFILAAPKSLQMVTAAMKFKEHLPLGRNEMTNLDSILKSRDITLLTKVHIVKAVVFPVIMYGCESWTIKKAEHWRTDAFYLWGWRRLLRAPWAPRSNQSILKNINPEFIGRTDTEAETPIISPSDAKSRLIGKVPDAGKDWRLKEKRKQGMRRLRSTIINEHAFEQTLEDTEGQGSCSPWCHKESDMTEQLNCNNFVSKFICIIFLRFCI